MMIALKMLRTRVVLFGGSNSIRESAAEMVLDTDSELVLIKRRDGKREEYMLPLDAIEHMVPLQALEGVFADEPVQVSVSAPSPMVEVAQALREKAEAEKLRYQTVAQAHLKDADEMRMVKINGEIVGRSGPKLPDELLADKQAAKDRINRLRALVMSHPKDVTQAQRDEIELDDMERATSPDATPTPPAAPVKKPGTIAEMLADSKAGAGTEE